MPETLEKLRPDRDLQCYFERPSAIAALSATSPTGFTVSGCFRQQFDWAVIEWNRDNVFEHPALRCLPDGDLSGLTLTYDEARTNCIPMDSDLYPTVDWPTLRIWATPQGGAEDVYKVSLLDHAAPVEGSYQCAYAELQLQGTPTTNDYVGFAFLDEHHTYQVYGTDTLETIAQALAASVKAFSTVMDAEQNGTTIKLIYVGSKNGVKQTSATSTTGANGNRIGVYTYASAGATESWNVAWAKLSGGTSPTKWRVTLNFSSLQDNSSPSRTVPANNIRKMRWTYSADLQDGAYQRSEFQVVVSNWTAGGDRTYSIAGHGSQRIEDDDSGTQYTGSWSSARGNFSGGTIHSTTALNASVTCQYRMSQTHKLYLGTRLTFNAAQISISVDGQPVRTENLLVAGEDVLVRLLIGDYPAGPHSVTVTHSGPAGNYLYFDFLEQAIPATTLPTFPTESQFTLATDWDTDHSIALAPERTAWILRTLGFAGRANHYVGALWFYELVRKGHQYASGTVTFTGTVDPNKITTLVLGRTDQPPETQTTIQHLHLIGDTPETIAKSFELELNRGYTGVWAAATGNQLTIYSRSMGEDGNKITLAASTNSATLTVAVSGETFAGGTDGDWRTDLAATPRVNRAARDWCQAYYGALKGYGIDVAASFSMELQHGDPAPEVGIAQVGPAHDPILLPTPALQTNFSPQSLDFWKVVYSDMAQVQAAAGLQPFLQFGEVQWWYFPTDGLTRTFSGMPFYDDATTSAFRAAYGRDMAVITTNTVNPQDYPDEVSFLPQQIGNFTSEIMNYVRATFPTGRFEVLYPTDVNQTAFNKAINYPAASWTSAALTCLKTESFGFTLNRDLDSSLGAIEFGKPLAFPASERSHLVGVGDSTTAWLKEARSAQGEGFESVVLFALDQFCLIGYPVPLPTPPSRSLYMG